MDSSPWPGPLASVAALKTSGSTVHHFSGGDWGLLVALLVVLILAALASASETALTSVSRIKIRNLAQDGNARAQLIEQMLHEPNTFLSTILVLNNVAVIVASTLSTLIALDTFSNYGEIISTVLISLIVLIFCEITPKTAAVQAPERWAMFVVQPVYALSIVLKPVIVALTFITTRLVRLFGGKPQVKGPFVTEEELRMLVEVGEEEGVLEEEEKEMIHNVFELGDTTVREVMVPRIDMVTVEADDTVQEALNVIVQGGQSRIPVYSESIDNIIGVLYAKDLLKVYTTSQRPRNVRPLVRQAYFVPETKRLDDLLHEMQRQRVHMAIVVDEYGGVAGLVTIEDLVEEIIGDIQDEYDREEVLYERQSEDEYIVDAKMPIDDLNELMDSELPSEDYDTLGGFVYSQLDKIPSVGDTLRFDGLAFTVLGTKGRRVTKVKVVRRDESDEAGDEADGGGAPSDALPAPEMETPQLAAPSSNDVSALPAPGETTGGEATGAGQGTPGAIGGTAQVEPPSTDDASTQDDRNHADQHEASDSPPGRSAPRYARPRIGSRAHPHGRGQPRHH
jgi:magnesium and cobalt exporter, CNNM family